MSNTRAQLNILKNQKILSGNSDTTAARLRDYESEFINSAVNKVDDMNAEGGFLAINSGRIPISFINSVSPGNYFLRDDGTWQPVDAGSISGTAGRITVISSVVDIDNTYTGQQSITTTGAITVGTWSGRFSPRIATTVSASTITGTPATKDVHIISALAANCTLDILVTPTPLASSEFCFRIKDNGSPWTLTWDPTTIREVGSVVLPAVTIVGETLYVFFKYNTGLNIWDAYYCTEFPSSTLLSSTNSWTGANTFSNGLFINTAGLTIGDVNVALGVGSGTKFGTSTSQKISFYNSTPIVQPGATTELGLLLSSLGLRASGTAYLITTSGTVTLTGTVNVPTVTAGTNTTDAASTAFVLANSTKIYSGSFSGVGTATTVFTVTIGATQANATYKVNVTPTSALSAALFYITNKTTTTFDVTYLAGLTGTVTFDWSVIP